MFPLYFLNVDSYLLAEHSQSAYVHFVACDALQTALLTEWKLLDSEFITSIHSYLLELVQRPGYS